MSDAVSKVPLLLTAILRQEEMTRNEICCKLRAIISALGGGTNSYSGMVMLTSGGTDTFDITAPIQGTTYNSVAISVISLSTGTVTVDDDVNSTDISYPGFSTSWNEILNSGSLIISVTGDAIALITYNSIA